MTAKRDYSNLDFVRTIAVLCVMTRHMMGAVNYAGNKFLDPQLLGILGVLMFFVHTSLVLMFSQDRQQEKHGDTLLYPTFIVRRFFRIYPLSMAVVLCVYGAVLLWPGNAVNPAKVSFGEFASNLFLIQNLVNVHSIIGPLWSLPLEVQMYLVLPFLFLGSRRLGTRGLLLVVWPASILLAAVQYKFPLAILDVLRFAPCFIPGVICYTLYKSKNSSQRQLPTYLLPLLLLVCMGVYMVLGKKSQTFGAYPVCLGLGLTLPFIAEITNSLVNTVCKTIAQYSYSIYLLHAICLSIVFHYLPHLPVLAKFGVFFVMVAVFSYLTYHLIEAPMIRLGNKIVSRQQPRRAAPTTSELVAEEPTPVP